MGGSRAKQLRCAAARAVHCSLHIVQALSADACYSSRVLQVGEGAATLSTWHVAALERMRSGRATTGSKAEGSTVQDDEPPTEEVAEVTAGVSSEGISNDAMMVTMPTLPKGAQTAASVDELRVSDVAGAFPAYVKLAAPETSEVAMEAEAEAAEAEAAEARSVLPASRALRTLREPALRSRWLSELPKATGGTFSTASVAAGVVGGGAPSVLVLQRGIAASDFLSGGKLPASAEGDTRDQTDVEMADTRGAEGAKPARSVPLKAPVEGLHTRFLLEAFMSDAERELMALQQGAMPPTLSHSLKLPLTPSHSLSLPHP